LRLCHQPDQLCLQIGRHAGAEATEQFCFEEGAAVVQSLGKCFAIAQLAGVRQVGQHPLGTGAQFAIAARVAGHLLQSVEQARQ